MGRRPARRSGHGGDGNHGHDTISLDITVYYAFHPLHGQTLRAICRPRDPAISVTVMNHFGHGLRIPAWMLSPEAAHFQRSDQAIIALSALRTLANLIDDVFEEDRKTSE